MKKLQFLLFLFVSIFSISGVAAHETSRNNYDYSYDHSYDYSYDYSYDNSQNYYDAYRDTECHYSNASVGVGHLPNGVIVTVDSFESSIIQCIKNYSWVSYFSSYGNTVNIQVSNTTLGVQIVATSQNSEVSTKLKNTQWASLINGASPSYPTRVAQRRVVVQKRTPYIPRRKLTPRYEYTPTYPIYNPPVNRTYKAGSSIFNTYQMYRAISYQSNGVKMTLTSVDYRTMQSLQGYYYTGLFSEFSGISVSVVNISGGVEVTVTSGSSSTVEQIQKIGYALVYN